MLDLSQTLDKELALLRAGRTVNAVGRVKRFDGQIVHASAFPAAVGNECRIACGDGKWAEAEVIGFLDDYTVLVLTGGATTLVAGARVETVRRVDVVDAGPGLLGRVFDGAGKTLDELPPPVLREQRSLKGERVNPLRRRPVHPLHRHRERVLQPVIADRNGFKPFKQCRSLIPRRLRGGGHHDVFAVESRDGNGLDRGESQRGCEFPIVPLNVGKGRRGPSDQVHLVDCQNDMLDPEHGYDTRMPHGLNQKPLAGIDQNHGGIGG